MSRLPAMRCVLLATLVQIAGLSAAASAQPPCPSCVSPDSLIRRFRLTEASTPIRQSAGWRSPVKIVTVGGREWAAALKAIAPAAEIIGVSSDAAALAALADADVYIGPCYPDVIRVGTRLRWVQMVSAGAERCANLPEVTQRGITLTNAQAIYAPAMADHAMALLLALSRRMGLFHEQQRRGVWRQDGVDAGMFELEGKTMLVLGLGGIGTEIASRAHAFGMRVIATRNSSREGPAFVEYVGLSNEAATLAARADVVVNVVPLTPETRGLYDASFFRSMKETAFFISVGRGETVVTSALVEALRARRLAGAALDVTDPEPLPSRHPLWKMPNVVLTPHSGGASDVSDRRLLVLATENLRRYVSGDRMLSVVDPRRGY
jgi:phosphoglycerate dehydrogenase-like enzyme